MNKKWTSRVLAVLLVLGMLLTGSVFAEDPVVEEPHVHEEIETPVAEEQPAEAIIEEEVISEEVISEEVISEEETLPEEEVTSDEEIETVTEGEASVAMMMAAAPAAEEGCKHSNRYDGGGCSECPDCGVFVHNAVWDGVTFYTEFIVENATYEQLDDHYHTETGDYKLVQICQSCDAVVYTEDIGEQRTLKVEHGVWEPGEVCSKCGYVVPEEDEEGEGEWEGECLSHVLDRWCRCEICGEQFHQRENCVCVACGDIDHTIEEGSCVCTVCGESWHVYDYEDGDQGCVCSACGKEEHTVDKTDETIGYTDATYTFIDKNFHYVEGTAIIAYRCTNCYKIVETKTVIGATKSVAEHDFEGDTCACGYTYEEDLETCDHSNTFTQQVRKNKWRYSNITATTHTVTYDLYEATLCSSCYMTLDEVLVERNMSEIEPHFNQATDGGYHKDRCVDCGYQSTCTHPNAKEGVFDAEGASYVQKDAEKHILKAYAMLVDYCPDCGLWLVDDGEEWYFAHLKSYREIEQDHTMADGKCVDCGYEAPAATPTPTATAEPTVAPTATVEPTVAPTTAPTATAAPTTVPTMPAASDVPTATVEPTVAPTAAPTVAPTAAPTAKPVVTAAPAATEAPAATPVPAIEAEAAVIEIRNVEKVLTTEETTALKKLPVKEQLMTFLVVIGLEEQVKGAMAAEEKEFSEEAIALQTRILDRFEAMTEEEKAAFEAMLLESFPTEIVVIDGVEHTLFIIEIEVTEGDATRIERYGLEHVDGEWILTLLEDAEQ